MKTSFFLILFTAGLYSSSIAQEGQNITIVPPGAGNHLDLGSGKAIVKIPGEWTNGAFSQIELIEYPSYETPLHVHDHTDEVFYILEGTLTVLMNGERQAVEAGSFVLIPKGTPHAQGNFTDSDVHLIVTFYPAGFENFFEARAEIVKEFPPGSSEYGSRMRELGSTYDIRNIEYSPFERGNDN